MGLLFASATDTVKDDSANQYLAPVLSGNFQNPFEPHLNPFQLSFDPLISAF